MTDKEAIEVEVEAEVIGEISTVSKADEWLAAAREKVTATASEYREWQIKSNDDYRQMKRDRAEVRRRASEIDAERKAMLSDLERQLRDFKAGVKDVLAPLTALDAAYKAEIDAWDARIVDERRMAMAQEYAEGAPDLVPLVPFERLCERFAAEGKWFLRSTGDAKATEDMWQRIQGIAECEQALDAMGIAPDLLADAKARYFSTLDLAEAMRWARQQAEQRERVAELERQREERRREAEEAERAALEAAARLAETAREPEAGPVVPEPEGVPETPQAPAEPQRARFVFEVTATIQERDQIIAFLKSIGVRGRARRA